MRGSTYGRACARKNAAYEPVEVALADVNVAGRVVWKVGRLWRWTAQGAEALPASPLRGMPGTLDCRRAREAPFIRLAWPGLCVAVLGLLGFWLFPEEPAVPALLLTAVAVPIAVVGLVVTSILVRRDIARAEDDDEAYYELGPMEPDSPDNG